MMLRKFWPLISALDSCFLLSAVSGWTEDDKPLPGRPSSPLPLDKFSIKGPQRQAAELRPALPPTGSSCTEAADGLALGRHLGKPESWTRPEPSAGTAPGRKPPRDVLLRAGGKIPKHNKRATEMKMARDTDPP